MASIDRERQHAAAQRSVGAFSSIVALLGAALVATPALADPPTWTARYGGGSQDAHAEPVFFSQGGSQFGGDLGSRSVAVDPAGNIYVAGTVTLDGATRQDYLVEKYDSAGVLLWYRTLDGGFMLWDTVTDLALAAGAVYVTGESCKTNTTPCQTDFLTVKYDAVSGALLWAKRADGPGQKRELEPRVAVDAQGTPFVAGTTLSPGLNRSDFMTIKYDPATGAETWRAFASTGTGESLDLVGAMGVGPDGHVVVSGAGDASLGGVNSLLTVKHDTANGGQLWIHNATLINNVYPHAIVLDAASNPIVVGETDKFGDPKFFTLKYLAGNGGLGWMQNVNYAPAGGDDGAHDVALDGSGNVYVTGRVRVGGGYRFHTVKYEAGFGTPLWVHTFGPGSAGDDYIPTAIAVNGASNRVIVAGYHETAGGRDFFAESLNAANGNTAPLQVSTDVLAYDRAVDVAIDSSGNVIVAGGAFAASGLDYDLMLLKYTSSLAELWRVSDPEMESHEILGSLSPPERGRKKIALDDIGSVVTVSSTATTAGSASADFLVQKYGPGGNLVWSRRIDGGMGDDHAVAVAATRTDVYVTGWSNNSAGVGPDILTLRLSAADGTTIWSKRYDGPTHNTDISYSLALGADRVFVAGASHTGGQYNFIVIGYPMADGNSPWVASFDAGGPSFAYAVAVGCHSSSFGQCIEGAFITGAVMVGGGNSFLTAAFDGGSGATVWGGFQSGGDAVGNGIAAFGNPSTVVATGRRNGDWMTTAFLGNSPTPLWTVFRDFEARDDQAFDVAFDAAGRAFVTGFATKLPAQNRQAATVKYDAATGAELAVARFGPIDEDLTPYGVATDFSGQVYVAGSRYSLSSRNNDFLFLKYTNDLALLDGDFIDTAGLDDRGTALAVEKNSGDAVVAGTTYGLTGAGNLLVAKYRSPEKGFFHTSVPCRVFDSRVDAGGPLFGGQSRTVMALGSVGGCWWLPPSAKTLAMNITVVGGTAGGFLQIYPGDIGPPGTSVINFPAGRARANNGMLRLAGNGAGTFTILSGMAPSASVHVIVDVAGYFD